VPAIAVLTLLGWNWLAVALGILGGTIFFLWGMATGGSLGMPAASGRARRM